MQDKNFQYGLTFGSRSNEKFQDVYDEFIAADLAEAQAHLHELPESERRGLTLETLRHFHCGYLAKWQHPKSRAEFVCGLYTKRNDQLAEEIKTLPPPSERIIIPTSSRHFNAVATPAERIRIEKAYYKQHAGEMEIFCDADAFNQDFFVIVEGEIDAVSIWQASGGKIPAVAILGCGNWKKTLEPRLKDLRGKKIILLLDGDAAGRKAAQELRNNLIGRGFVTAAKFLYDVMNLKLRTELFGNSRKVDANDFLTIRELGGAYLNRLCEQIINNAGKGIYSFSDAESRIKDAEKFRAEYAAMPDPELPAPKRGINFNSAGLDDTPAATHGNYRRGEFSADIDALIKRINDTVTFNDLEAENYLQHTDKGGARPNGYICPFCGSGTKENHSGALGFTATPPTCFKCLSCGQKGNVLTLLSKIYGIDNHGKAFYELLRRAADDFNIPYEPKIFEHKTPAQIDSPVIDIADAVIAPAADVTQQIDSAEDSASATETAETADTDKQTADASASQAEEVSTGDPALDDDIRAQLEIWQEDNGNINPAVVKEIFAAAAYVSKLNADNFKREDADDLVVRRRIALLKYYAPKFASKFFEFLRGVKVTNVRDIEREIDKGKRRVEAKQKDFWHEQAAADAEKKRNARALAVSNNIEELQRLRNEPPSFDRDNKLRDLIRETVDWQLDRHGDRVAVKANADNLHKIFTFDPALDGLFGYEQFVEADVFLKPPPWNPEKQRGDEWNDRDDAQLRMYLRTNYTDFTGRDLILDGVTQYSDERAFHPIKDYFRNLPTWDNQLRAATIFCKYLGAEDNAFNREVTLNWLLAAVARIFHSGCQYQLCPILKGAQGIGKSFIIETLGGKWYSALNHDVNSEQAFEVLRNSWLIEFKELRALRKVDVNSIKAFIDTAADNRRAKYDRRAKIFKRHCVTIATTNDEQFLSDVTGNRRFPIIECFNPRGQHGEQPTHEEIAQIWAEVFHRYCEMFNGKFDAAGVFSDEFDAHKLNLSEAAKPIVEELAEQHMRDDGLQGEVQSFLDKPIPAAVIWNLLTKDERRKFFADEKITIERDALHARFYPANKNRQPAEELRAAYEAATAPSNFVKLCTIRAPFGDVDALTFYGTEQRQHICAAEILNEAFANSDRRVSMRRIVEVLSQFDGWTQGKRIQYNSAYGDQRNIFYRDADNQQTEPPADNADYDFDGEPIDNFDVPDFKEDKEGR